jgi:hypothetical protein
VPGGTKTIVLSDAVALTDCVLFVGYADMVPGKSALGFEADPVVNGGSNALLATEVSLGR